MASYSRRISPLLCLALMLSAGCASSRGSRSPRTICANNQGVIFVADGAGDFQATSAAFRQAAQDLKLPLCVETIEWSHGYARVLADQVDRDHSVAQGRQLAGRIVARKQITPCVPIYLVAHSAGTGVVLAAAEALPPNCVDRMVLLAPAVSSCYDLRPVLRTTRRGIDVYYSHRDRFFLGLGTTVFGTTDGLRGVPAAGRTGFQPNLQAPQDQLLYVKLRQHPWHPSMELSGNYGGHYGSYEQAYLRDFVLPQMLGRDPAIVATKR